MWREVRLVPLTGWPDKRKVCLTSETGESIVGEKGMHVTVTLGISGEIDDHPLAVISGITEGTRSLEPTLRQAVAIARRQRHTWEEIGQALGTTRQSAWERFATD